MINAAANAALRLAGQFHALIARLDACGAPAGDVAALERWLAACRAQPSAGDAPCLLRWPEDADAEASLVHVLIRQMAADPAYINEFCEEFFWDQGPPPRRVSRLVYEITPAVRRMLAAEHVLAA